MCILLVSGHSVTDILIDTLNITLNYKFACELFIHITGRAAHPHSHPKNRCFGSDL